ncbi:hypothetical protein IJT93_01930 [bacterium]|nr:hypothetical protein [bacterium]
MKLNFTRVIKYTVIQSALLIALAALSQPGLPQNPETGSDLNLKDQQTPLSRPLFKSQKDNSLYDILEGLPYLQRHGEKLTRKQAEEIKAVLYDIAKNRTIANDFYSILQDLMSEQQLEYSQYLSASGQLDDLSDLETKDTAEFVKLITKRLEKLAGDS